MKMISMKMGIQKYEEEIILIKALKNWSKKGEETNEGKMIMELMLMLEKTP